MLEEVLVCERELDNMEDGYAVAELKDEDVISIPRKISFLCSIFEELLETIVTPMICLMEVWKYIRTLQVDVQWSRKGFEYVRSKSIWRNAT